MKKIAKYFFAAVAMTAAVSCVKELDTEVVKPVEMTGKAYVFSASFDAETKTVLDEETLVPMWFGDQDGNEFITVMEPGSVNTYVAEGIYEPTAEVTFVMAENGGAGLKGNAAFAVSPAGEWSCFSTADSLGVTVTYPQSQIAYDQTYDPAARVAVAYNDNIEANPHFNFKNASALLKFNLVSGSDPVTSVKFYSLGGEPLAGQMTLMVKDSVSMIVPAKGASNWVEIKGMYGSELDPDTDYYIAVAPSVLKKGIGFQFNDREDVQTFTISKEINIERNKIYDLGSFLYEASNDNKWYLVGNVEDGEPNTFANVMFQEAGNNLVAQNVTLAKGQSFKVLNPGLGEALYVNADEVVVDTWNVLIDKETLSDEEQKDFPFAIVEEKGTYDIYIDYVDEKITGVALVKTGEDAPEYLSPEGMQFTWFDNDYEYNKVIDLGCIETGVMHIGLFYDDLDLELSDPEMSGKWMNEQGSPFANLVVTPKHAVAGTIVVADEHVDHWGDKSFSYTLVKYSNFDGTSISLLSTYEMFETEEESYVRDENGDILYNDYDWPYMYESMAIGIAPENWGDPYSPQVAELLDEPVDICNPVPPTEFIFVAQNYDDLGAEYLTVVDMGVTESGVLTIANGYDFNTYDDSWNIVAWPYESAATNKWFVQKSINYTDIDIVAYNSNSGVITLTTSDAVYEIPYSQYSYRSMILLENEELGLYNPYGYMGNAIACQAPEFMGVNTEKITYVTEYPATPDGAQWLFKQLDINDDPVPYCFDLGVYEKNKAWFGVDMYSTYGSNLPKEMIGMYEPYGSIRDYEIVVDEVDPTSGVIYLKDKDSFGDETIMEVTYTGYNGGMFYLTCEDLYIYGVQAVLTQNLKLYDNGGVSM